MEGIVKIAASLFPHQTDKVLAHYFSELVKFHLYCERNARIAYVSKNYRRQTEIRYRTCSGFKEVISKLKSTRPVYLVVLASDVDETQCRSYLEELRKLCADRYIYCLTCSLTKTQLGELVVCAKHVNNMLPQEKQKSAKKYSKTGSCSVIGILEKQPIFHYLEAINEYFKYDKLGLTPYPFKLEFTASRQQRERQIKRNVNPFSRKNKIIQLAFRYRYQIKIQDRVVFRLNFVSTGTHISGAVEIVGDEQSPRNVMCLNDVSVALFSAKLADRVLRVSELEIVHDCELSRINNLIIEFERMRNYLGYKRVLYDDNRFGESELLEKVDGIYQIIELEESDPFSDQSK